MLNETSPVEELSLPERLRGRWPRWTFIPSEGWESVLCVGASGRLWRLDFAPRGRCIVEETALSLPNLGPETYLDWKDVAGERVVIEYDDHLHVFDLTSGRILLRVRADLDCYGTCLTPDGQYLIWFDSEETRIWHLDEQLNAPTTTSLFHTGASKLVTWHEPHSAARATKFASAFHIVVGNYALAIDYPTRYESYSPQPLVLDAEPRLYGNFVLDPVYALPGGKYPIVLVKHGYGCGLKAIDVNSGAVKDFVESMPGSPAKYEKCLTAIPSLDPDKVLVQMTGGWVLWSVSEGTSNWLCKGEWELLNHGQGWVWSMRADDPTTLLRYAVAG